MPPVFQFILKVLIIAVGAVILGIWLPWYIIAVVALLTGFFMGNKPGNNFLAGFLGIALPWLIMITWKDIANNGILSGKIATLFSESLSISIGWPALYIITILIGGMIGGLSCLCGALLAGETNYIGKGRRSKKGMYKVKLKYK